MYREPIVDLMRSNDNHFITYEPSPIHETTLEFEITDGFNIQRLVSKIKNHKDVLSVDFSITSSANIEGIDECIHYLDIYIKSKSSFVTSVEILNNDNLLNL